MKMKDVWQTGANSKRTFLKLQLMFCRSLLVSSEMLLVPLSVLLSLHSDFQKSLFLPSSSNLFRICFVVNNSFKNLPTNSSSYVICLTEQAPISRHQWIPDEKWRLIFYWRSVLFFDLLRNWEDSIFFLRKSFCIIAGDVRQVFFLNLNFDLTRSNLIM